MGLEEIAARIDQDAKEKADKILQDAKAEAARTTEEANAKAATRAAEAKARAEREVKEERLRSVASARLAAKRELLLAREDVLKKSESDVEGSIDEFTASDGYAKFLAKVVEDGVAKIGDGAVVMVNARDKGLLKGKKTGGEVSKEAITSKGGALIVSADGKRRVDNTIESLLRERGDALRLQLVEQVFGDLPKTGS